MKDLQALLPFASIIGTVAALFVGALALMLRWMLKSMGSHVDVLTKEARGTRREAAGLRTEFHELGKRLERQEGVLTGHLEDETAQRTAVDLRLRRISEQLSKLVGPNGVTTAVKP